MTPHEREEAVRRLHRLDLSDGQIAEHLDVGASAVWWIRRRLGLPARRVRGSFAYANAARKAHAEARREDFAWLRSQGESLDEAGARVGVSPYPARHRYAGGRS